MASIQSVIGIGWDPGFKGGIVAVSASGIVARTTLPTVKVKTTSGGNRSEYDHAAIEEFLSGVLEHADANKLGVVGAYEVSSPRPGEPARTGFAQGRGQEAANVHFHFLRIPFFRVSPITWRNHVGARKIHKTEDTKHASLRAAQRLFPGELWRATKRCTTPHDGLYEAALIARWVLSEHHGLACWAGKGVEEIGDPVIEIYEREADLGRAERRALENERPNRKERYDD